MAKLILLASLIIIDASSKQDNKLDFKSLGLITLPDSTILKENSFRPI